MLRLLKKGLSYAFSLQWIEDAGRFVIYALSFRRVPVRDTRFETVEGDFRSARGFGAKLIVVLKAIVRFFIYLEIGLWFWFAILFLAALLYVLIFGSVKPVHEW